MGCYKPLIRGSPPRMRGKAFQMRSFADILRITPAYAGKSSSTVRAGSGCWDHPRVCGEKAENLFLFTSTRGSPPRMRGKDVHHLPAVPSAGITPAYAGKRQRRGAGLGPGKDHPRVCGEKVTRTKEKPPLWGSPPRMRGKVMPVRNLVSAVGITPAYAGKSSGIQSGRGVRWDHPRVCGEKLPVVSS